MSKRSVFGVFALALVLAAGWTTAMAQDTPSEAEMKAWMEAGAPGPHHAHFEELAGTWDAKISSWMAPGADPMVTDAKSEYTVVMGGRYLKHEMTGTMMGMPYNGMGLTGYDNLAKKHTMMWIDNMSTQVTFSQEGECSDHCHVVEQTTTMLSGLSDKTKIRMVSTVKDKDHHMFQLFAIMPDGSEFKSMEIQFTRSS